MSEELAIRDVIIEPSSEIQAGDSANVVVHLVGSAPSGFQVHLDSNQRDALDFNPVIEFVAGMSAASAPIRVKAVEERTQGEISVSLNGTAPSVVPITLLPRLDSRLVPSEVVPELRLAEEFPPETTPDWRASLPAILPFLPIGAAAAMVCIYLAPIHTLSTDQPLWFLGEAVSVFLPFLKAHVVLSGAVLAIVIGIAVAGASNYIRRATSAGLTNVSMHGELIGRLRRVQVQVTALQAQSSLDARQQIALKDADSFQRLASRELTQGGLRWVLGTGYIAVWILVHRAEEALILAAATDELAGIAAYDFLRLQDSQIDSRDWLQRMLRYAASAISPAFTAYMQSPEQSANSEESAKTALPPVHLTPMAARQLLCEVRRAINTFRDDNWSALVRTRNHLLAAFSLAGVLVYLLTIVAMSGRSSTDSPVNLATDAIAVGTVFVLVGAVMGLLETLRADGGAKHAIEDYGAARARLIALPLLSGISAIGGVILIQYLPATLAAISNAVAKQVSFLSFFASDAPSVPTLGTVLNLETNATAVLVAAVFGFAPNVFLRVMRTAANEYEAALTSTGAGTTSAKGKTSGAKATRTPVSSGGSNGSGGGGGGAGAPVAKSGGRSLRHPLGGG